MFGLGWVGLGWVILVSSEASSRLKRTSQRTQHIATQLTPSNNAHRNARVIGGSTLELALAQFWSSLGSAAIDVEISFHGVQVREIWIRSAAV